MKKFKWTGMILFLCFSLSCVQGQYIVRSVENAPVAIDSTWDVKANPEMVLLVEKYKKQLNEGMDSIIGTAARTLQKGFPQSLLSNFTADAMQEIGEQLWGDIDFAVMNMGGLRSTLNQGNVSLGNLYEIYPFDNQLVLLELTGKAVQEFFEFIASNGGQGLSKNIRLTVNKRSIESLEITGKPLDKNKTYRIATIDFLAEGNDGMIALKQATSWVDSKQTLRDLMIKYVKKLTDNNLEADATIDHRITIHN